MFLKTVIADGAAENRVIAEMKARASAARADIETIVRGVMDDVRTRGMEAVEEYAVKFDGVKPYEIAQSVLDEAYGL